MEKLLMWYRGIPERSIRNFLMLFLLVYIGAEWHRDGDFRVFLEASAQLFIGVNIYEVHYFIGSKYFYSPLFAIIIHPFTYLDNWVASLIWKVISLFMLLRSVELFHRVGNIRSGYWHHSVLGILFVLTPILGCFHMIQMSFFLLYAVIESMYQIFRKDRVLLPGLILGLAINVKIMPIVFICYLVYRAKFKAVFSTVAFVVIFTFLPSLILGFEVNISLLKSWFALIDPSNTEHLFDVKERGFQGLTTLLTTLFTDRVNPYELQLRRHLVVLQGSTVIFLIQSFRAILILGTLYILRTWPFKGERSARHTQLELAYLCAVIPMIFPHQQGYGLVFLLPASLYVFQYLSRTSGKELWKKGWFKFVMASVFLLFNTELIFGFARRYFWFFKTMTYGALLLIIILVVISHREAKEPLSPAKS